MSTDDPRATHHAMRTEAYGQRDSLYDRRTHRSEARRREAAAEAARLVYQPLCAWCAIDRCAMCARLIPGYEAGCACSCAPSEPPRAERPGMA